MMKLDIQYSQSWAWTLISVALCFFYILPNLKYRQQFSPSECLHFVFLFIYVVFQTCTHPFLPFPSSSNYNYACEVCFIGQSCFIFLSFSLFLLD